MADVRSMLRSEREKRRITHPHASYTTDGKLLCNLCEVIVKTETAWQSHLHSSQHSLRLNRARDATSARSNDGGNRKRKASDLDSPAPEDRKKPKPAETLSPLPQRNGNPPKLDAQQQLDASEAQQRAQVVDVSNDEENVDASQIEAFDRELAEMEAAMHADSASISAPTISAAPMTAAEVAAQAREEQSAQRGKREAELEAEREDAARTLEDEFEEMETLEGRVKRLRERREALRKQNVDGVAGDTTSEASIQGGATSRDAGTVVAPDTGLPVDGLDTKDDVDDHDDDDDNDDEESDDDEWNFGAK